VTAVAAGDLARGDVAVASLVQMSASDMAGAVASPAEETPGDASVGRAAGDRRDTGREPSSVARGARCFSARGTTLLRGTTRQHRTGPSWASNDAPLKDLSNTRALKHLAPLETDYWAASIVSSNLDIVARSKFG
jgi:hypothetical protein